MVLNNLFKQKKAAELPLNVIVISILVVIVLLVIIVFFTTKVGQSGNTIDEVNAGFTSCSPDNQIISSMGYSKVSEEEKDPESEISNSEVCKSWDENAKYLATVSTGDDNTICCATK